MSKDIICMMDNPSDHIIDQPADEYLGEGKLRVNYSSIWLTAVSTATISLPLDPQIYG